MKGEGGRAPSRARWAWDGLRLAGTVKRWREGVDENGNYGGGWHEETEK